MRTFAIVLGAAALVGSLSLGECKLSERRAARERRAAEEEQDLVCPEGRDKALAEEEAMRPYADSRGFGNLGCNYLTETLIILDNSSAVFDKELWMYKLLVKEIAAAMLNGNESSRLGLILTTAPINPTILPATQTGGDIPAIWQAVKGIQRVQQPGDVYTATQTAIRIFNVGRCPRCTFNLLLLTAPYTGLGTQLTQAATELNQHPLIRRFAVATRVTSQVLMAAFDLYVGCRGCQNVEYIGNCSPIQFLFLIKRVYPRLCAPLLAAREATTMTFQVDGMAANDETMARFVEKFIETMSQTTGVDKEYLEVIDVRDSGSTGGPQYNRRQLKSIDSLIDYPQDTLLDVVIRENPSGLGDTPFRIADRLDTSLRNDVSPVSSLFAKELGGVPKVRKISQPRESIFARSSNGFTFQKLHLGSSDYPLGQRQSLTEILQQ